MIKNENERCFAISSNFDFDANSVRQTEVDEYYDEEEEPKKD